MLLLACVVTMLESPVVFIEFSVVSVIVVAGTTYRLAAILQHRSIKALSTSLYEKSKPNHNGRETVDMICMRIANEGSVGTMPQKF